MAEDYEIKRLPRDDWQAIFRTGKWTPWGKLHMELDRLAAQAADDADTSDVLEIAIADKAKANLAITSAINWARRNLSGWGLRTRVVTNDDQTRLYLMLIRKDDND